MDTSIVLVYNIYNIRNQESCIINGGTTTKYFKLEKGARQKDQISAYFFSLVLEIVFFYIKQNKNIKCVNIFNNIFLYSAYVDGTTVFVSDEDSVIQALSAFDKFSLLSGLKSNKEKCEIAGNKFLERGITGTLWYGLY